MEEKAYEEVGANYRFFLRWRHAAVVGDLIILWAVLTLCISAYEDARQLMWVIPLCASPVGIILWIIDFRTRKIYHTAIRAGADLEGDVKGFYTRTRDEVALPKEKSSFCTRTHSFALEILFFGTTLTFVALSIGFYCYFR